MQSGERGTTAVGHTEECRNGVAEELEKIGDERLEHEEERPLSSLKEESERKQAQFSSE